MFARRLLAALAMGLFLPGCPLTDHYYIDRGSGTAGRGATPDGSSGLGGTFLGSGGGDGVGAGEADGSGASTNDAGAGFGTGGDTSVGGDSSAGGTGGTTVGGMGGTLPIGGGGRTTGGTGGRLAGGRAGDMKGMAGSPGAGAPGTGPSGGDGPTGGMAMGGAAAIGGMADGGAYQPVCDDSVVKGAACMRSSTQFCYRGCGPDGVGFKSETCTRGVYDEGACQFPASGDYSCYSVPAPYRLPAACPMGMPRAADTCDVQECTPCFGGTTNTPQYQDSSGAQKTGYCVCNEARVWTCATSTDPSSWPCPGNAGCN